MKYFIKKIASTALVVTLATTMMPSVNIVKAATATTKRTWSVVDSGYEVAQDYTAELYGITQRHQYIGPDNDGYIWFSRSVVCKDKDGTVYSFIHHMGVKNNTSSFEDGGTVTVDAKIYTEQSTLRNGGSDILLSGGELDHDDHRLGGRTSKPFFDKTSYNPNTEGEVNLTGSAALTLGNKDLKNGYKFKITASCGGGTYWWEYQLKVEEQKQEEKKDENINPDIKAPVQVTKLTAKRKSKRGKTVTYNFSWKKISKNCTGYIVQLSTNKAFPEGGGFTTSGTTQWRITKNSKTKTSQYGLKKGKTYYIRVRAYNSKGNEVNYGKWSKTKKFKAK